MAWKLIVPAALAGLLVACATAAVGPPLADWAGAYGLPQPGGPADPDSDDPRLSSWVGSDVLEIRPLGPTRAAIDVVLFFPYGHQCSIAGDADLIDGKLVLKEKTEWGPCELGVWRETNRAGEPVMTVRETSEPRACQMVHCGARGSFGASIPVSTRHSVPKHRANDD